MFFIGNCLISFNWLFFIIEGGIEKKYFLFIFFIVVFGFLLNVCRRIDLVLNFFKVVIVGLFVDCECIFSGRLYLFVSLICVFKMFFWIFLWMFFVVICGWKFKFIFFIVYILLVYCFIFVKILFRFFWLIYFCLLLEFFWIGWIFK